MLRAAFSRTYNYRTNYVLDFSEGGVCRHDTVTAPCLKPIVRDVVSDYAYSRGSASVFGDRSMRVTVPATARSSGVS